MELRSLASRAVPARACAQRPAGLLRVRLRYRRAQQQLLPLAPAGGIPQLAGQTAGGFRLSVKAPRGLTHARKLYAPEAWLPRIAAGWHELGGRRAVLLVQLPPSQPRDDARLAYFLRLVPGWMRVAVEFRHPSWYCEEIFALLESYRAAYCVMSGANLPCVLRATTDLVYLRMHGPDHQHLYAGSYPDADLRWWADRIREWSLEGRDVFAYFNNDGNANAVRNARTLRALVGPDGASHPATSRASCRSLQGRST